MGKMQSRRALRNLVGLARAPLCDGIEAHSRGNKLLKINL